VVGDACCCFTEEDTGGGVEFSRETVLGGGGGGIEEDVDVAQPSSDDWGGTVGGGAVIWFSIFCLGVCWGMVTMGFLGGGVCRGSLLRVVVDLWLVTRSTPDASDVGY